MKESVASLGLLAQAGGDDHARVLGADELLLRLLDLLAGGVEELLGAHGPGRAGPRGGGVLEVQQLEGGGDVTELGQRHRASLAAVADVPQDVDRPVGQDGLRVVTGYVRGAGVVGRPLLLERGGGFLGQLLTDGRAVGGHRAHAVGARVVGGERLAESGGGGLVVVVVDEDDLVVLGEDLRHGVLALQGVARRRAALQDEGSGEEDDEARRDDPPEAVLGAGEAAEARAEVGLAGAGDEAVAGQEEAGEDGEDRDEGDDDALPEDGTEVGPDAEAHEHEHEQAHDRGERRGDHCSEGVPQGPPHRGHGRGPAVLAGVALGVALLAVPVRQDDGVVHRQDELEDRGDRVRRLGDARAQGDESHVEGHGHADGDEVAHRLDPRGAHDQEDGDEERQRDRHDPHGQLGGGRGVVAHPLHHVPLEGRSPVGGCVAVGERGDRLLRLRVGLGVVVAVDADDVERVPAGHRRRRVLL